MTQQELSALVLEVQQLQSERAQIDERSACIGTALMDAYPVDDRPDEVSALLDDIDNL